MLHLQAKKPLYQQVFPKAKKLVAVSATSMSITEKKIKEELEWVPCICYHVTFNDQTEVLLDSKNELNTINQTFASQLELKIWKINVEVQKIDDTIFKTYEIVISIFSLSGKDSKERFFKESFLLVNIKPNIVLGILFLIISNIDINFQAWDLH